MQQTEKYKLNLIDPEDEFSPEPLNRNAETVEAQFQAREAAEAALQTAIGAGGKNARVTYGSYTGNGITMTLTFDFKPILVVVSQNGGYRSAVGILIRGNSGTAMGTYNQETSDVSWDDNAVRFRGDFNDSDKTHYYIAIGESL